LDKESYVDARLACDIFYPEFFANPSKREIRKIDHHECDGVVRTNVQQCKQRHMEYKERRLETGQQSINKAYIRAYSNDDPVIDLVAPTAN
jgi:hypothetical protein